MSANHKMGLCRLVAWGLCAVLLMALTGCQEKEETPKGAGYYSGPMQGKKVQGTTDTATPTGSNPAAPK